MFAVVMATGIVSVAADDHGVRLLGVVLAVVAAACLAVMVVLAVAGKGWDYRDPDVIIALFTFVAACAVLATRFRYVSPVVWTLGVAAVVGWLVLAPLAARDMWSRGWLALRDRAHGGWELASVATSGVAIVFADLKVFIASWPVWVLAIAVYALMTSLILWRAAVGATFAPDDWILMGGLAIATLAGARLDTAAAVVTWVLATLWIPVLLYLTLRVRPKLVQFGWWAMVFPLGMYSSATYATAVVMHWPALKAISLAFLWIALGAWVVVAFGSALSLITNRSRT
jgi:tellurite resistance protein TehA-like permease